MVQRDLKIRYKNSVLGFFWSLLNPLITVVVLSFVISNFMRRDAPSSISAYVLVGYLPFTFFQVCLMDSAQTILGSISLIKKIYFPREILPLASVVANFVHLVLAMGVFFLYLLIIYILHPGQWPFQIGTLYLPVLLIISFALALGLCFLISAVNTFYEDVKYILSIILWLLFFITPVMYFGEDVANSRLNERTHGLLYTVYNLNPITALVTAYRKTLLAPLHIDINGHPAPVLPMNWNYVWFSAIFSFAVLFFGYSTFNRLKWRFVERP
jgi:lipopolysaccharide transport system permease protein